MVSLGGEVPDLVAVEVEEVCVEWGIGHGDLGDALVFVDSSTEPVV